MSVMRIMVFVAFLFSARFAAAHDTWVETNSHLFRVGDAAYVDLKLGNHGNDHRDFKLAGKVTLEGATLNVIGPDGHDLDLIPGLVDVGYSPSEGYWSGKYVMKAAGLYTVAHSLDRIVNHGRPIRSIKSAKAFFLASPRLDRIEPPETGWDTVYGHPLELVPMRSPVAPMGPGQSIAVRVLYQGQPLPGARVSFVPRRVQLTPDFDHRYERITDAQGNAEFTPTTGDRYLVVVHHREETQAGERFEGTHYSATLTVLVPETCPCCGE